MQIVAYLRVSTARQGASGLGLEAQRAAVQGFAAAGGHTIVAELVEVESGSKADRPQLAAALAMCRLHRATLVIAKLDRLARNVAFIANLMDGGVEFVACDMPHANRLTLHLLAAIAEHEREMISQRTKAALAAAKARGVKLGNPMGAGHLKAGAKYAASLSVARRADKVRSNDLAVAGIIAELSAAEHSNDVAIARGLNERGVPSPRGMVWSRGQVARTITRLASYAEPCTVR
ncbi:recombinase family protein [Sphingomonas taxi]|uniref:recombinase family protein n=1 Tax=Sphingomonas taxi TaxID=1549858 RepID=UPI0009DCEAA6|nr:recombinase family protein [Sphingomonas taxi]